MNGYPRFGWVDILRFQHSMPSSSVLIAATNHQSLLDPAVWRRFVQKVEVELPDEDEVLTLMSIFSENFESNFSGDKQKIQSLAKAFQGLSPSDIKTIYDKAKVKSIISDPLAELI